jgi:hypothetical protein
MPVACDKVVIMRQKQGGRKDDRMTVFHLTIFWSSVHHFYSIFASNSSSVNLRYKQAMSSDNAAKEHKVCLTWNGRHEIVALTPNMTMHDLRNKVPQELLQMDAPVMMHMRFASIHLRVVATKVGYICQEHAALFTTYLDRNLLRVDYARINRIDKDDNGKIVALGILAHAMLLWMF